MVRFGARRAGTVAGAVGMLVACLLPAGQATEGWKKPVTLGPAVRDLHLTDVYVGSRGDSAAVWYSKQGKKPFAYHVRVATSRHGRGWGKPAMLYAGNHGALDDPDVVVNGFGVVTALWAEGADGSDTSHCSV